MTIGRKRIEKMVACRYGSTVPVSPLKNDRLQDSMFRGNEKERRELESLVALVLVTTIRGRCLVQCLLSI